MVDFNVRGGRKLRKSYNKIKKAKTSKYLCPTCSKKSVKRIKIGVWECISCKSRYAGGAYEFTTSPGNVARRIIKDLNKGSKIDMEMEEDEIEMDVEQESEDSLEEEEIEEKVIEDSPEPEEPDEEGEEEKK
jgi:large subunit ribosomal protein L37Ae